MDESLFWGWGYSRDSRLSDPRVDKISVARNHSRLKDILKSMLIERGLAAAANDEDMIDDLASGMIIDSGPHDDDPDTDTQLRECAADLLETTFIPRSLKCVG